MRTTQLVAHNGALQCNANRLRRPVNEGTRKPRSDARLEHLPRSRRHRYHDTWVRYRAAGTSFIEKHYNIHIIYAYRSTVGNPYYYRF